MKRFAFILIFFVFLLLITIFLSSCITPAPRYTINRGYDNQGNNQEIQNENINNINVERNFSGDEWAPEKFVEILEGYKFNKAVVGKDVAKMPFMFKLRGGCCRDAALLLESKFKNYPGKYGRYGYLSQVDGEKGAHEIFVYKYKGQYVGITGPGQGSSYYVVGNNVEDVCKKLYCIDIRTIRKNPGPKYYWLSNYTPK